MKRRLLAALLGVAGVVIVTMFAAAPSAHAFGQCSNPPIPAPPSQGITGLVTIPPADLPPADADPFAPGSPWAIDDVYGPGWHWTVHDLSLLECPIGATANANANISLGLGSIFVGVLSSLEQLATETGLPWLAEWAETAAAALTPLLFGGTVAGGQLVGLAGLFLLALAVWVAFRGDKLRMHDMARRALIVAACVCVMAVSLTATSQMMRLVDTVATTTARIGGSTFSASLTDGLNRQVMYRAWRAGQFADADSELALREGPQVIAATRYTWREWNDIRCSQLQEGQPVPDRLECDGRPRGAQVQTEINERKADSYREVADRVEGASAIDYQAFRGNTDRLGSAWFGLITAGLVGSLMIVALALTLLARLIMGGLVIAAAIGALFGILPRGEVTLLRMLDLFGACVIVIFKFTLSAGLLAMVFGAVAAVASPAAALFWMVLITVAAFKFLKPLHAFKAITPGLNPNISYIKKAIMAAGKLVAAAVTSGATAGVVAAKVADGQPEKKETADLVRERVELRRVHPESPEFRQVPGTHRHELVSDPGGTSGSQRGIGTGPVGSGGWSGVLPRGPRPLPPAGEASAGVSAGAPSRIRADRVVIEGEVVSDNRRQLVSASNTRSGGDV